MPLFIEHFLELAPATQAGIFWLVHKDYNDTQYLSQVGAFQPASCHQYTYQLHYSRHPWVQFRRHVAESSLLIFEWEHRRHQNLWYNVQKVSWYKNLTRGDIDKWIRVLRTSSNIQVIVTLSYYEYEFNLVSCIPHFCMCIATRVGTHVNVCVCMCVPVDMEAIAQCKVSSLISSPYFLWQGHSLELERTG